MFKKCSKKEWFGLKKLGIPVMVVCFLICMSFLPGVANAFSTSRTISGTITYLDGFAPEEGIWVTMCAMGDNGGTFTTDVLIREWDNMAEYSIPIDLTDSNGSNSFMIKCEPQKAAAYSSSIYSTLVDITNTDATDIDFTIQKNTERTISGTITYTNIGTTPSAIEVTTPGAIGVTSPSAIGITVYARGDFDFATYVVIPEGCNQVEYSIPIDLNYVFSSTSFTIECIPDDTINYTESEYESLIDVYDDNVPNINLTISDNTLE